MVSIGALRTNCQQIWAARRHVEKQQFAGFEQVLHEFSTPPLARQLSYPRSRFGEELRTAESPREKRRRGGSTRRSLSDGVAAALSGLAGALPASP
jgi:hypothetical protein